jgi:secreted PhoX family phosphatase
MKGRAAVLAAARPFWGKILMSVSRRHFLRTAAALGVAAPGLELLSACAVGAASSASVGFGPLVPDPAGLIDLPAGFSYSVVSRAGEAMDDGLIEPGRHDGMAAFPVPGSPQLCVLVRNHENTPDMRDMGAFRDDFALANRLEDGLIYDWAPDGRPLLGGASSCLYDLSARRAVSRWLSLAGTASNCSGGPTPWGSWISCEETQETVGPSAGKAHGFAFEVDAAARGLTRPTPIRAMGRFKHEAAAVDPLTGIVYQTEDVADSLIYRFLPERRGVLLAGGRLQALAIEAQAGCDTRNWGDGPEIAQGTRFIVRWIDLDDVEAPDGDLRLRGRHRGAAIFARGEGMAYAAAREGGHVYFTCTSGGARRLGQIWRYRPSRFEGGPGEGDEPATLELLAESRDTATFDMVDNICASPFGHMVVAEDGGGDNFLRGVTPRGEIYALLRNAHPAQSELCGPCFSPDGSTLFVNIQKPGMTVAVTGPWSRAG